MKQAPDPLYFLIFFPLLWFAVTMLLSFLSGWFGLMERFPDRTENPLLTLTGQSGSLGKVSMSRILTLSVCPAGLRIGIMRIFGPFSRDFLVPRGRNHRRPRRSSSLEGREAFFRTPADQHSQIAIPGCRPASARGRRPMA